MAILTAWRQLAFVLPREDNVTSEFMFQPISWTVLWQPTTKQYKRSKQSIVVSILIFASKSPKCLQTDHSDRRCRDLIRLLSNGRNNHNSESSLRLQDHTSSRILLELVFLYFTLCYFSFNAVVHT